MNECTCFPELLFKEGLIFGMTPVEMHLKPFGNKLEFVTEPFRQNTSMPFGVREFCPNGIGLRSKVPVSFLSILCLPNARLERCAAFGVSTARRA